MLPGMVQISKAQHYKEITSEIAILKGELQMSRKKDGVHLTLERCDPLHFCNTHV